MKGRDPKLNLYTEQKAICKQVLKKSHVWGQEIIPDRGNSSKRVKPEAGLTRPKNSKEASVAGTGGAKADGQRWEKRGDVAAGQTMKDSGSLHESLVNSEHSRDMV